MIFTTRPTKLCVLVKSGLSNCEETVETRIDESQNMTTTLWIRMKIGQLHLRQANKDNPLCLVRSNSHQNLKEKYNQISNPLSRFPQPPINKCHQILQTDFFHQHIHIESSHFIKYSWSKTLLNWPYIPYPFKKNTFFPLPHHP